MERRTRIGAEDFRLSVVRTVFAAASILAADAAAAADAVHPYVHAGTSYDSNLFRFADDSEAERQLGTSHRSDYIRTVGAGLDADIPISRQQLTLKGNVDRNDYKRFSKLNHTAGEGLADWGWRVGREWDGHLRYDYVRRMAGFTEQQVRLKDMVIKQAAELSAGYQWHPRWQLLASGGWNAADHGAEERKRLDRNRYFGELGLDYITPADTRAGVWARQTDTNFPNRQLDPEALVPVDNSYKDTMLGVSLGWQPTGKSSLRGRLAYERRDYDEVSARNFDGVTGRLTYRWAIAGKTQLQLSTWRELNAVQEEIATYVDEKGAGLTVSWQVAAKVSVEASGEYATRDYEGSPGVTIPGVKTRKDDVGLVGVSVAYEALHNVQVSLKSSYGNRDSNRPQNDYDYWDATADVRVGFY